MKVKTVRKFKDLKARKMRSVGEVFEVTKERFEGINSTAHGVLVEAVKKVDFDDMTKKELVEYAKSKNIELDMKMTKQEMIKGLM